MKVCSLEAWNLKFWELRIKGILTKEETETITIDELNPALKILKQLEKEKQIKIETGIYNGIITAFNEISRVIHENK